MSGVLKSIGKVFKKVTMAPIKLAKKLYHFEHKIAQKAWHIKIIRYIAIAVAVYFTAGAAMAYFGAAGAAGGVAGTTAVAATGTEAAGGTFFVGSAAGSAAGITGGVVGGAAAGTGVAATTLAGVTVTASAVATPVISASTIAAASVGAAAGMATANAASANATDAMQNGNGTTTGAPGGLSNSTSIYSSPGAQNLASDGVTNLAPVNVYADAASGAPAVGSGEGVLAGGKYTGDLAASLMSSPASSAQTGNDLNANNAPDTPDQSQESWLGRQYDAAKTKVSNLFSSGTPAADGTAGATAPTSSSLMGEFGKSLLLKSAVDFAAAYLQKPPGPVDNQYSGVSPNGSGSTLQVHTINGGFGLATGGGEKGSTGVPNALLPSAVQATGSGYRGASSLPSLSNPALAGMNPAPKPAPNLVPQGPVDYMGGQS